jgi:hypothetical protein
MSSAIAYRIVTMIFGKGDYATGAYASKETERCFWGPASKMWDIRVKKPCSLREARLVLARVIFAHDHGRRGISVVSDPLNRVGEPPWASDAAKSSSEFVKS